MKGVVLAGGLGTRLGLHDKNLPKSLVNINGEPFIKYQFEFLKKGGIDNAVLCLG